MIQIDTMYFQAFRKSSVFHKCVRFRNQLLKPSTVAIANIPDKNFSVVPVGGNPAHVNNIPKISQQQTRSAVTDTQKLHYQIIDAKDSSEVLDFLKENFFADEPLNRAVGILENTESVKAMSVYSTKGIEQNISYLARSESGELVGVSLNSVKGKCDPEDDPETDPIFGKISRILGFAYDDSKFFEKFPDVDRVVSVDIISVDKKFQGHGIAKVLMDKTRDLARKKGIKMIRVDCTSHFSARASEKLGMQCIYELKYSDYKENGVQVFKPEPPHTGLKVYVQRLDS